jgi:hypothetical protein
MMPWTDVYPQNYNVAFVNTRVAPGTTLAVGSPFNDVRNGWTPALRIGGVAAPGAAYVAQQGFAHKQWPYVEADFNLFLSAKGGGSGHVEIAGLPYACGDAVSGSGLSLAEVTPAAGLTGMPYFFQTNNSPVIYVMQGNATGGTWVTDANLLNNSSIRGRFKCLMQWVQR